MGILSSASLSIVMRLSEKKVKANISMLAVNYMVCFLCAGAFTGIGNLLPIGTEGLPWTLGVSVFNGFFYLSGFVFLQVCVKKNGVVLSTTFLKLGLLVPIVYSVVCALHGFLYGTLYAPAQALLFGLDFEQMIAWIIAGLPWDLVHGVSNFICGLLICPIIKVLSQSEKYLNR